MPLLLEPHLPGELADLACRTRLEARPDVSAHADATPHHEDEG